MSAETEVGREEPKKRGAKSQYAEERIPPNHISCFWPLNPNRHNLLLINVVVFGFMGRFERVRARVAVHPPQYCYGGRADFHRGFPADILEGGAGGRDPGAGDWDADLHDEDFVARAVREHEGRRQTPRAARRVRGVPVPCGDSEQLPVNSDQSSVSKAPPCTHGASGAEDTAAGQKGNLTHDHDLNHNLVLSGPSKAPPCTHTASGGEDVAGTEDSEPSAVNSDQLSVNSDQSPDQASGQDPEAGQWADDYDQDHNSDPSLPPPYEPWWRPGMDVTVTMLEDEAYRLAIEGVLKPIYQRGTEVGERRVRSERLLQFLLITSAFKKYGRREVGPLQAEEEPGRPEFMAKLNAIYGQDEELHRKFTEVFERNNARRHAERHADLERKNRASKPPSWGEVRETGRRGDTETGQRSSGQRAENSGQSSATARRKEDAAGQKGNLTLDHDLDHNLDLVPSGPACGAPSCGEDTVGTGGSDQLSATPRGCLETPECPESGEQSRAQIADNERIARQENPAGAGWRGSGRKAETAENQDPPPEHDASWYSPSARAARITQSMIEHRLRKRRIEM